MGISRMWWVATANKLHQILLLSTTVHKAHAQTVRIPLQTMPVLEQSLVANKAAFGLVCNARATSKVLSTLSSAKLNNIQTTEGVCILLAKLLYSNQGVWRADSHLISSHLTLHCLCLLVPEERRFSHVWASTVSGDLGGCVCYLV